MKSKNQLGLTLSLVLLSTTSAIAQPKPTTSPQLVPSETISTQQQKELEKLRQEKEIRNTVQTEVDRVFNRTTNILNILLVLGPIVALIIAGIFRHSIINQVLTQIKGDITNAKDHAVKQFQKEMEDIKDNIKQQLETDILTVKNEAKNQLQNIITESHNSSENIKQDIANATQEIESIKFQSIAQLENATQEIESIKFQSIAQLENAKNEIESRKSQSIVQLENAKNEIESRKSQIITEIQNSKNQLIAEINTQMMIEIEKIKYDAQNAHTEINRAVVEVQQRKSI